MGDVSNEPSMEHILSSIKRIIAEDGEGPIDRRTRPQRAALPRSNVAEDDVLELSEPVVEPAMVEGEEGMVPMEKTPAASAPEPMVSTESTATGSAAEIRPNLSTLVSDETAEASRQSLETLSRLVVKPEVTGTDTLEGLVRDMLKPVLREWLDANLPQMVETMVAREISRISGRN